MSQPPVVQQPRSPVVAWQRGIIRLHDKDDLDCTDLHVLTIDGRTVLRAIVPAHGLGDPVSDADRQLIGQALAEYLASDKLRHGGENLGPLRDQLRVQGEHGNWNCNEYMLGMFNGLECALATLERREPQYRRKPTDGWLDDRIPPGFVPTVCDGPHSRIIPTVSAEANTNALQTVMAKSMETLTENTSASSVEVPRLVRLGVWLRNLRHWKTARAYRDLTRAMQRDPEVAHSWQCNIACPLMGEGMTHADANKAADRLMRHLFGVKTNAAFRHPADNAGGAHGKQAKTL